jgi:hypothetical protein
MRRRAFLWSTSTLYIGIVLLMLSNQNGAMINLSSDAASNRMTSDRLQLAAYNVLLDLNRYLSHTTTEQIFLLAQAGQPPKGLESMIRTDYWIERMVASLKQDGVGAEITITNLEVSPHQNPRDLVQMTSLSLPVTHALYEGAVDINCDLSVTLTQPKPFTRIHTDFKVRTLSPTRIFGLLQQSENLKNLMEKQMRGWLEGEQPQKIAAATASKLERLIQQFYRNASKEDYRGECRFTVEVRRSAVHRFEVQLKLEGSSLTDLSPFSYTIVASERRQISLNTDRTFSMIHSPPTDAGGPDWARVVGTVTSPSHTT